MGRIGLVALALGLAAVPCVHAGALSIHRVEVDEAAGQMRISGDEFGNDEPSVTLEGIPMVVVSHSPTEIVITLPPGTTPGTYLLNVWRLDGNREQGVFNVTVGAEGPQARRVCRDRKGRKARSARRDCRGSRGPQGRSGRRERRGRSGRLDHPDQRARRELRDRPEQRAPKDCKD